MRNIEPSAHAVANRIAVPVATTTVLETMTAANRVDGMIAAVAADHSIWVFDLASTDSADSDHLVPDDSPTAGRWIRCASSTSATLYTSTPTGIGTAADDGASSEASKGDHSHPWALQKTTTLDDTITGSADTNGTPNTPINVGTALPASAIICAVVVTLTTQASGGSVTAANLDVGWSGATEALIKDLDLVAVTGGGAQYIAGTSAGTLWTGIPLPAGGKQVTAIVTPDASHKLSALTALSCKIDVYYYVQF